jgi:uncharacterized membrane protein YtjA (UPF0391 family)
MTMAPYFAAVLAQDDFDGAGAAGGIAALLFNCFVLLLVVFMIAGMWKVFTKAGKPGWAAIIPIYNYIVLLEIVGRPSGWIILLLIPCVNFVIAIIVCIDLAKSFGKDALYGVGLALLGIIFFPILGFGSATYRGPSAPQA